MINQIGGFEEIVETGQSTAQNVRKAATASAKNFAKAAQNQIAGSQNSNALQNDQGTNEQSTASQKQMSDDQAKQFLKDLYGPTKPKSSDSQKGNSQSSSQQNPIAAAIGMTPKDPNAGKSPEELAKIHALRNTLHQEYYQTLTNPAKPTEENVTEKLEREEQEKQLADLEVQKKKPAPLVNPTMKKGTAESVVGVNG